MAWPTEVREESFNVMLAELLAERGLKALGEVILKKRPDVLLDVIGIRIILEGKKLGNRNALLKQAESRLDEGMCDICVMVEYAQIKIPTLEANQKDIKNALVEGIFNVASLTLGDRVGLSRWIEGLKPKPKVFQEDVDFQDLVTYLMAVYGQAVSEDVLGPVVKKLDHRIHEFARAVSSSNVNIQRLKEALDLRERKGE